MNILEPVFAKVLDSTWCPNGKAIAMIDRIFEVQQFNCIDKIVVLNGHTLSFSDIQIITPVFYKGVQIGIGDTVKITANGRDLVVVDCYKYNGNYRMLVGIDDDVNNNITYAVSEITSHTPLYRTKVETLKIGGIKYNKEEVEKALKNIKPV